MSESRAKNTSRNVIAGILLKLYQIIFPFIIRTVIIYTLGMEYVGLNSLFSAILQVLNMTELGVGTAMVYSMYKPIAENDKSKLCGLLKLYKHYYRIIGVVIVVVGIMITPLVPRLINKDTVIPVNVYYLYWINLAYIALSYLLFAYKGSLLQAHQRTDIISKIMIFSNTCMYLIQMIVLIALKSYYLYVLAMVLGQILINIITSNITDKKYPEIKAEGIIDEDERTQINQRVKDLFTAKVGGVVQSSADSIVISVFLGLKLLGKYNNYYYIMSAVFSFICILLSSSLASVGNSLVLESKEKNYNDFKKLTFVVFWIAAFCSASLLCLLQPFIGIWAGLDNVLPFGIVICLSIYLYIITINQMLCVYKDASGIWHEDRYRPLLTAILNLFLNLLTVKTLGLYGIVLSTVISLMFFGTPWLIHNVFSCVFVRSSKEYVKKILEYGAVSVFSCCICYFICSLVDQVGIIELIIKAIICLFVPNILFWLKFHKSVEYVEMIVLANKLSGYRLERIAFFAKTISDR